MAEENVIEEVEDRILQWDIFDVADDRDLCVICGKIKLLDHGLYVHWRFSEHDFVCFDCFNDRIAYHSKNWELFHGRNGWDRP